MTATSEALPGQGQGPPHPEGQLLVASTPILFYASPQIAKEAEPSLVKYTNGTNIKPERRGAVTVVWEPATSPNVRHPVDTCAFA